MSNIQDESESEMDSSLLDIVLASQTNSFVREQRDLHRSFNGSALMVNSDGSESEEEADKVDENVDDVETTGNEERKEEEVDGQSKNSETNRPDHKQLDLSKQDTLSQSAAARHAKSEGEESSQPAVAKLPAGAGGAPGATTHCQDQGEAPALAAASGLCNKLQAMEAQAGGTYTSVAERYGANERAGSPQPAVVEPGAYAEGGVGGVGATPRRREKMPSLTDSRLGLEPRVQGEAPALRRGPALITASELSSISVADMYVTDEGTGSPRPGMGEPGAYAGGPRGTTARDCEDVPVFETEATVVDEIEEQPYARASAVEIDKEEIFRRRTTFWVGVACCIIIGVLIIGTSLMFVFQLPTNEKVYKESAPITPEERRHKFREQVRGLVYNQSSLEDNTSAQNKALRWILKDPMYLHTTNFEQEDTEKFAQRFYLAVFFFSMTLGSSSWEHCKPPETGEGSTCVHQDLESYAIEGEYHNQYMKSPAFRWLTNDECRWAGVICADGKHISHLHLAGYGLIGTIPVEVAQLSHLQSLDLQQNSLSGLLPPEWGTTQARLPALESLRLDQNHLTGTIPDEWCDLSSTHLHRLILANNELTGTLPSCLPQLTALEDFSVMHNFMTGGVPSEFGHLLNLETLHLAGNFFSGTVPQSVCSLRDDHNLFEASSDCLAESSSFVECSCCTKCCDGSDTCDLLT